MTKSDKKVINRLLKFAKINKGKLQTRRQFHCATIIENGKVLSIACNSTKTHPQTAKYYPFSEGGTHAEFATILAAKGISGDYRNAKIYIIRLDNNNMLAYSAPCESCTKLIKQLGFKKIIHS